MKNLRLSTGFAGFAVLAALPCVSAANTYVLHRNDVIPIVFNDKLTVSGNRPGDVFTVRVTDTGQLPRGSELVGRIDRIHPASGRRPASMDMRLTQILLPDNSRVDLDSAPMPLDDRYITRTGDGRMVAKQDVRQQQNDVLGGAIGGFIVGSLFHRRVTGLIIGTMIGISAAESERAKDSNVVVNAGDKAGALINHEVVIDFREPQSRYGINEGLDRPMADPIRGFQGERAVGPINMQFRNKDLVFPGDARPYRIGKVIMVPLEPAAGQMALDVDRRRDRTIYVDGPDSNIRLTINSRQARLDGKRFDLPRSVLEINGVIYVPLDALLPVLKDALFVNGAKFVGN